MPRSTIPHLSLIFGGYIGPAAGLEIWQCGINLTPLSTGEDFTVDAATAATRCAAITPNLATLLAAPITAAVKLLINTLCDGYINLTYIKLNAFGANTLQTNPTTIQATFAPYPGAQSGGVIPWSTAVVFEHRTLNRSRGFASHGRMSLPAAANVDRGTGRVVSVGTSSIAAATTAYGTFLAKLNLQTGSDTSHAFYPSILYGTDTTKTYKIGGVTRSPVASKVDSFFLSTIPGEIRTRQNKLPRLQTTTAVTYGAVNV